MNRNTQERVGRAHAYHYRPFLEPLEQRRLLTSVTGVDPLPNTHDAPVTTDVSAVFDTDIDPATVSAETFSVHGMQTGQILESLNVSGDTITLSPTTPFHAGELVQATLTGGIENLTGEPLAAPHVWHFRTTASGGTGLFSDGGQNLGNSYGFAVALGDVDGDGDLDAFVGNGYPEANKVWLNDGSGNFTDSGQNLGDSFSIVVALGDVDGDGDLDAFVANEGFPDQPNKVWLNQDPIPGDFDNNQHVDGNDFLIWQTGFGTESGATRYDGDADGDGDVDGDDFLIWQAEFGTGDGDASAVPTARSLSPNPIDSSTLRGRAMDETFAELDRLLAQWTKRSLRDEMLDELTLFEMTDRRYQVDHVWLVSSGYETVAYRGAGSNRDQQRRRRVLLRQLPCKYGSSQKKCYIDVD